MTEEFPAKVGSPSSPHFWVIFLVVILLFGLLGLLGFGLLRAQQGPIGIGDEVPDITLTTFDGEHITLSDLGGQAVVINFWASWCTPCEEEAAIFEQAYQLYKDRGVVFLGVDYADTEREALAYLEKYGITYPNGPDLGTRISQAFRTGGVPETYIVGPDGHLADVRIGPYATLNEIINAVERVLGY